MRAQIHSTHRTHRWGWLPLLLIAASLACALPFAGGVAPTPTIAPTATSLPKMPTPTPQPQPASLVETNPPLDTEVALQGPITLYFNQPMDHNTVEAALTSQLKQDLRFQWVDDTSVVIYLSQPMPPESHLVFELGSDVRSAGGKPLFQPVKLSYQTASYLRLLQNLPATDATEVDPTGAIVASFNRPVVALGADPASLPAAFTLSPSAQGQGKWLNTSTYAFYPEPSLEGGRQYTVNLNPDLKSVKGGPLQQGKPWSFTTALPALLSVEPSTEQPWPLDPKITVKFNQPMDTTSVETSFQLTGPDGSPLNGQGSWDEDHTTYTFKPAGLLARNTDYRLSLGDGAKGVGGSPLGALSDILVVTVPQLGVMKSEPAPGETQDSQRDVALYFNAPIKEKDALEHVQFTPSVPELNQYYDSQLHILHLTGQFAPSTSYSLQIDTGLEDIWGGTLAQPYALNYTTQPLRSDLFVPGMTQAIFLTPSEPSLLVQAANLSQVPVSLGSVSLPDFLKLLGPNEYDLLTSYRSPDQHSWTQSLNLIADRYQPVDLFLSPDGSSPLAPGLYLLRFEFPQNQGGPSINNGPYFIVVSNAQITYKISTTDALAWVVDLRSGAPMAGAPVTIYEQNGAVLASGQTDDQGIFRATFPPRTSPSDPSYAVVGQPGEDTFGIAVSTWTAGISPYEFGLHYQVDVPGLDIYYYTDRPIYRPGQTVYFRAIARTAYDGRYTSPEITTLPVQVLDDSGQQLAAYDLPLDSFGSANGSFEIPADARPGFYQLYSHDYPQSSINFQVASYRKPEINLQVTFASDQIQAGQKMLARINARYFFDAPVGNLPVNWTLYASEVPFELPGYKVGPEDNSWLKSQYIPNLYGPLGKQVSTGQGVTGADGTLALDFPTEQTDQRLQYTLEVGAEDESRLPMSARDSMLVNPDVYYIGLKADAGAGKAGEPAGFEIYTVDWNGNPAGGRSLKADFQKVTWERKDPLPGDLYGETVVVPHFTPVASTNATTNSDGLARLSFTPADPGTYMLDVYSDQAPQGKGARSQMYIWVGGPGQAVWPDLPNSRLRLSADKPTYLPGDTAQVFIPNPFGADAPALISIERSTVFSHQVTTIPADGYQLALPLGNEQTPNVYLSVTLLGKDAQGRPDFRQGYIDLAVKPVDQTLQVSLASQPKRAGPGDAVTFDVLVTDSAGQPVQGEFSLSVVDLAVLSLADPNSMDIVPAYYGDQPMGVNTSLTLAAYNRRVLNQPFGGMGGGGGDNSVVRENFPDTAYWNAQIVTGADGKAQVTMNLPDSLTTWQVDTRGVTVDTRVGQAQDQIVTAKPMLVRPVTPRFFVANDHAQVSALVQNNTISPLKANISLKANGFTLDDSGAQTQQVDVPAGGRARVEWWGTVQDVPNVDLVFAAVGKDAAGADYQDAARPTLGSLPVKKYLAPYTFQTAGIADQADEIIELVSLPRSFSPQAGQLDVELSSSLSAAMLRSLDALDARSNERENTEQLISNFLPNVEMYATQQQLNLQTPGLKERLSKALNRDLQRLLARQNADGGWAWEQGSTLSDPYVSAYALLALSRSQQAGITIHPDVLRKAVEYLKGVGLNPVATPPSGQAPGSNTSGASPDRLAGKGLLAMTRGGGDWPTETWELDRIAFMQYTLAQAGAGDASTLNELYKQKDKLSPWGRALLALALQKVSPGSAQATTLLSDLQSTALRSASGVSWEFSQDEAGQAAAQRNMHTTLSNSAAVLYALAQSDPASPLVADGARYLMNSRDASGAWGPSFGTAWALLALNEVAKSTGELNSSYSFGARLNKSDIASGKAGGADQATPVTAQIPTERLYPNDPNELAIWRDTGSGRLYYSAGLQVGQPADTVQPLAQGMSLERAYFPTGAACPKDACDPIQFARVGDKVNVRLSLNVPHDMYFVSVSDFIPAGAEILDTSLNTSQLGTGEQPQAEMTFNPRQPFKNGFGMANFGQPQVYDDHISWTAEYLPAGAYELVYTLVMLQPGQYRAIPAQTKAIYFPDVQANTAGSVFEIKP